MSNIRSTVCGLAAIALLAAAPASSSAAPLYVPHPEFSGSAIHQVKKSKSKYKYKHPRRYRYNYNYWAPGAAFIIGGAIIGGILVAPRYYRAPRYHSAPRGSSAHVTWCYNHYKSYRASDNTFQPYHGPRKRCRSPYYR
ncbi:MAG: BA14K family protein [Hyphomicrobiales bacterium]|nr:BA14K family protein [Hyphomicrobiales bacterium]